VTQAHDIPDPLAFAADALMVQGALVERAGDECIGVLPGELAASLGIAESCTLTDAMTDRGGDRVSCGIGAPLLDRLTQWAGGRSITASLRLEAEPPRATQARVLADRFAVRNAVFDVEQTNLSDARYVILWLAWRAEADDRYDGRLVLALHVGDGAEPDPSLIALADPSRAAGNLLPVPHAAVVGAVPELLARRVGGRVRQALGGAIASVARRHARDHRRISEYFEALIRDTCAPKRRVEADAIAKKVEHLVAERDAKLRDLGQRYALRVAIEPLAAIVVTVPSAWVRLRVRRRKKEGELLVRLPAGVAALDRLTCAACGESTARPALCDDALHVLCESCLPQIQGRPQCEACAGARAG
jgi:hypothetical protein